MVLDPCSELMRPDDFVAGIAAEVDAHARAAGIPEIWKRVISRCSSEEAVRRVILHRLIKGYHQEIYIRDVAYEMMRRAPSLRAQEALLRQVDDEHRHALWVGAELRKKGVDPETTEVSLEVETLWDALLGGALQPGSFFVALAATQLVVERGFGLQSTVGFAEAIEQIDPDVARLYLDRIRRDELFHTQGLPEGLIREYATTVQQQNDVRRGIRKGRQLLKLLEADALSAAGG
jgi:hypothetical protein